MQIIPSEYSSFGTLAGSAHPEGQHRPDRLVKKADLMKRFHIKTEAQWDRVLACKNFPISQTRTTDTREPVWREPEIDKWAAGVRELATLVK
jgi:hypothetical protein